MKVPESRPTSAEAPLFMAGACYANVTGVVAVLPSCITGCIILGAVVRGNELRHCHKQDDDSQKNQPSRLFMASFESSDVKDK